MRHTNIAASALTLAAAVGMLACGSADGSAPCAQTTGTGDGAGGAHASAGSGAHTSVSSSAKASSSAANGAGGAGGATLHCPAEPVLLGVHPWASQQKSDNGKNLRNVHGFHGRLYFGYGDLNANTGPIEIASWDPKTKTWVDHLHLETQSVERFVEIGDELWAPCADIGEWPGGCQYASGDKNHVWASHVVAVSIHTMDATERVPGEALLFGSSVLDPPTDQHTGAFVWRSLNGGPFEAIFPDNMGDLETGGGPFMSATTYHGVTYTSAGGSIWSWDGTTWLHARAPGDPDDPLLFGEFIHPVVIADRIVFAGFGNYLYKFDGKKTERMNLHTIDTPTQLGFTEEPVAIFELSEGHLLLVNDDGDVLTSTDLQTFQCLGKAPKDVRGIGAMDGIVYFGAANGRFYGYEKPSW